MTIRAACPRAMALRLTDRPWSVADLILVADRMLENDARPN